MLKIDICLLLVEHLTSNHLSLTKDALSFKKLFDMKLSQLENLGLDFKKLESFEV